MFCPIYAVFVPLYQGELSPKKPEKEQVEAPRFRLVSYPPEGCSSSDLTEVRNCIVNGGSIVVSALAIRS
jgi:hypothetical protein